MNKIMVVGNSHCAAMREAIRTMPISAIAERRMSIDFFVGSSIDLSSLTYKNDGLYSENPEAQRSLSRLNGRSHAHLLGIDTVVICGGLLTSFAVKKVYVNSRWLGLPSMDGRTSPPENMHLVSKSLVNYSILDAAKRGALFPLVRQLSGNSKVRLIAIQEPRLSIRVVERGSKMRGFKWIANGPDADCLSSLYDEGFLSSLGGMAEVILQPIPTRDSSFFTNSNYCSGATRLAKDKTVQQRQGDFMHCNALYGQLLINQIAEVLQDGVAV